MTSFKRMLIDCDPGIDDAFALFCALKYADLAAITTVSGNVSIHNTTRNARHLMALAGADVPVHRGAAEPLTLDAIAADDIHGASGFGAQAPPEPDYPESPIGAVEAIINHCEDGDALIVAIGPLTNIALAIREDPSITDRIGHLHWMGGATAGGNTTALAEFNAWADPHAVDITLRSGVALTMYDLALTHQVRMNTAEIEALQQADTASSRTFAEVLTFYRAKGLKDGLGQPMHDPCAVLGVTHPALFDVSPAHIVCSTSNDESRGQTTVHEPEAASPHHQAMTARSAEVLDLIVAAAIDSHTKS
ncbi:MAG: inosine-uridine nucleoside N-ribohydrolase [Verrucomicrobiales bacterium]|jgi:inosine-uridine nucleoside N-ribohydrolase